MASKLGVYYAHQHDRPEDWDYIRRLQPPVIRVLLYGADTHIVTRLHMAVPSARISLRWWDIDDGGEGNKASKLSNASSAAIADAGEVLRRVEKMEVDARGNGWVFPPREKLIANTLNEPPIWEPGVREQTVIYNRAFLSDLRQYGIPVATGCINTGHPSEWPPVWDWFQPVVDAMIASPLNMLELHSYWQLEGPDHVWVDEHGAQRFDWGALAGRYMHCPYGVPILIGECGADGRLYGRKADHTGWQGNISATEYAHQLRWYHEQIQKDERIVAMLPFLTDYQNREWETFDTMPAREEILSIAVDVPTQPAPPVVAPGPQPVDPSPTWPDTPAPPVTPSPDALFERSVMFVLGQEGGWADNPADPGGATMRGITISTYTNWRLAHNQPAPTKSDLHNISEVEVRQIYHDWYWVPSGANRQPWPNCLAIFDLAVNGGVGRATQFIDEIGTDFLAFNARRLEWYTHISGWPTFGAAWTRRVAALLKEASK